MDKYEYRIRAEEINDLIEKKEYVQAVKIADTIDWRRVRSVVMLCKISELYKINRRYEESKEVLLLAYELQGNSRKIIYSLCELSIKLDETVQAVEYYKEFIKVAPRDTGRFILQYRIYTAQDVSLEERIAVLEEYQRREYREKWMYELAYLYHRIGLATRCIEECDDIFVWFGEGKYVIKALELKMLHAPLSPEQQEVYNARFMTPEPEMVTQQTEEETTEVAVEPSLSIEIKSVEVTRAKTEEIPSKEINEEIEEMVEEDIPEDNAMTQEAVYPEGEIPQEVYEYLQDDSQETYEYPQDELEQAEENLQEEIQDETSEDSDMKIADTSDDMDIQVKTIDVNDEYNTINLQDELAKSLAEMFAQEDMEAADATRALPIDSIFEATKEIPEKVEETTEEIAVEPEVEEVEEIEETPEVEEVEEIEETPEVEEVEEIEETPEVEEAEEIEETPEVEEVEEIEETPEVEEVEEIEEIPEVEEVEEIEETPEVEEAEEIEETPEVEEVEEIKETLEQPVQIPTVEPLIFNQNQPLPEAFIQAVQSAAIEAAKEAAKQAAAEAAAEAAKQAAQATAEAIKEMKPEITPMEEAAAEAEEAVETTEEPEIEEVEEEVEKQITGQLSFSDIMAEWEETKKANEEKHLQEMKQRVMEQTGPLLSDFDASTRSSIQSDLDMLSPMLNVFPEEDKKEVEAEISPIPDFEYEQDQEQEAVDQVEEELVSEVEEALSEDIVSDLAFVEPVTEPKREEIPDEISLEPEIQDRPSSFNTEEINGLEDKLMGALSKQHYDTANLQASVLENEMAKAEESSIASVVAETVAALNINTAVAEPVAAPVTASQEKQETPIVPRTLTMDEKALFGGIAPNKELQEKVAEVLDRASLVPNSNNIIICGEKETGTMETAENLVKYLSQSNRGFSGKSKVFSSEDFTGKDIFSIINEMSNGVMIIDNAGNMSADLCNKLIKAGNEGEIGGILYILVDTPSGIERLIRTYARIADYFNLRIDISVLDNDGLVKYGKIYAREREYSIDDMGVLALYNRIEERQTSEHAVTVSEVKQIIDQAIENSEKKSLSHFMDVLIAKRYDKEDMVILREKDFMFN